MKPDKWSSGMVAALALIVVYGTSSVSAQEITDIPVPTPSPGMEGEIPDSDPGLAGDPAEIPAPEPLALYVDPLCKDRLKDIGAMFTVSEPVEGETGCGIEKPVAVSEILPGITLAPETQMRCETALRLASWLKGSVLPSIEAVNAISPQPGEDDAPLRLTGVKSAASYDCRRRNNLPTGKLSEHSVGSAIDITSFSFDDGTAISVGGEYRQGSVESAFLDAVRAGACLHFTTVLGPGTDSYHDSHFHLDLSVRRGGYRYCR